MIRGDGTASAADGDETPVNLATARRRRRNDPILLPSGPEVESWPQPLAPAIPDIVTAGSALLPDPGPGPSPDDDEDEDSSALELPAGRWIVTAETVMLTALAGYVWSTIVRAAVHRDGHNVLLDGWLYNGILVLAAGLCLARAVTVRRERPAWLVLGIGVALWAGGDVYYEVFLSNLADVPSPTAADFLYLAFYPLAYASVVLLVRARVQKFHTSMWLDGAIGSLGIAVVGAAFVLPPIANTAAGTTAAVVTNLAYPMADVLLLGIVACVFAFLGWRPGRSWLLLGIGLVTLGLADSWYLVRIANDSYVEGTPLDALWPAALVLMALAAWRPSGNRPIRLEGWIVLAVPTFFTLIAVSVLVYGHFRDTSLLVVLLAAATLLAAMARTSMTFREVRALTDTRRQARTDELTGLGNRRRFYEDLELALQGRQEGESIAILLFDLDRFKEVNDSLGHHVGDMLLRLVGVRIAGSVRTGYPLARLGGDEFAALLPTETGSATAVAVAQRTLADLDAPFVLQGVSLHSTASIGIAMVPDHATDAETLLQRADVAMYQAKRSHCGYTVYEASDDLNSRDRLETIEQLRLAIDGGQLLLEFQPKVDLVSRTCTSVEALVRWDHPERGLLYPDTFIALAEQTGVMRPLTLSVLDMALKQCRAWRDQGHELTVAVNLSVSSLLDSRLPEDVAHLLEVWDLPATVLQLEITEHVLMADPVRARAVVDALRLTGIQVSIDDYGTGYSSLSYLRQLTVDELKVDKSFVLDMKSDAAAAAIVRSTIDLARSLGLRVVAEGVETEAVMEALADLGCDVVQGFHLCQPVSGQKLADWL